jgi:hypothetical protein
MLQSAREAALACCQFETDEAVKALQRVRLCAHLRMAHVAMAEHPSVHTLQLDPS